MPAERRTLAFNEKAAERLRRALGNRRGITEKKMMGALCFMAGGRMCCGITGSALMVRVGAEGFERALATPHVRPLKIGQRQARGFVLVDPPGYRRSTALSAWLKQGLDKAASVGKPAPRSRGRTAR